MEAFLVSLSSVAIAEMGDRTQLLALLLAARYRKVGAILGGILVATLANHLLAGGLGQGLGGYLTPAILDLAVGVSMVAMALWSLKPDEVHTDLEAHRHSSVFMATVVAFFIAEMGDKTQIATLALAAAYHNLAVVVSGTTLGMMIANTPAVFLGRAFADRIPVRILNYSAALLFLVIGGLFIIRATQHWR